MNKPASQVGEGAAAMIRGKAGDRYTQFGGASDLNEAVRIDREAVAATAYDDPDRGRNLSNLGASLMDRAVHRRSTADGDEAVEVLNEALEVTPMDHSELGTRLLNLGSAYLCRFNLVRNIADLDQAIRHLRQATVVRGRDHPEIMSALTAYGSVLALRFERTQEGTYLNDAIDVLRRAAASAPLGHPDRALCMSTLGKLLWMRFQTNAEIADAHDAIAVCREAVHLGTCPASIRLAAAQRWGLIAMSIPGQGASALDAYTTAADLLHLVAWRGLSRTDRERALIDWAHIPGDAASCALNADDAGQAATLLEHTRGILWPQLLEGRTDLSTLRRRSPKHADKLESLRAALDGDSLRSDGAQEMSSARGL